MSAEAARIARQQKRLHHLAVGPLAAFLHANGSEGVHIWFLDTLWTVYDNKRVSGRGGMSFCELHEGARRTTYPVSYTHLTLPTKA